MRLRNTKKIPIITFMVLFLSFMGLSFAQPTLTLDLAPALELAQVVYVSDFDFLQQGATQYFFQVTVDNQGQPAANGRLEFEVLRNGEDEPIASAATRSFLLPANEYMSASNIELNTGYNIPSTQEPIKLDKGNIKTPTDEFESELAQSGKLPKGNYRFIVKFVYSITNVEILAPERAVYIHNPSYIKPISPGTPSGSDLIELVYTQFPSIQFESDFNPYFAIGEPFRVQIFKKLEQHGSIDEALTSTPHFDEYVSETVFPYPAAATLPLDPGVYVWRVQLNLTTSSGTEIIESPVSVFRVEDPSKIGVSEGVMNEILRILKDLLGVRGVAIAQSLSDYNLIAIRVNGETLTTQQFYDLLENYQSETRKISDIILKGSQQ